MADAPDFLTVVETAQVLRIRRTAAYQLVNHDLATGGSDGLRARRFGKSIRVPRAALEELTGAPLLWPLHNEANRAERHQPASSVTVAEHASAPTPRRARRAPQQRVTNAQLKLLAND
jgi:hypothetical protein